MKKISTKIIMTIIICCITLSSILGAISIIVGKTLINKEVMDKLSYMSQSTGGDLNKKLEIPQNKVEYLSYDVINTFDIQQLKSDPQYIERYKDSLASDIKNYSEGSKSYSSMYFFFNSDLTGGVGDVYLADTKGTGNFERQSELTKEIAIIISEIQQEISLAKNTMDTGIDAVNQANTAIVETEKSFNLIEDSIENSLNHIDSLSRNLKNVAENKEKAIVSIERISTISEESAGAAEEVAAAVKEQTDAMNSISGTAEKLNEVAARMDETVGMFKLDSLS